MMELAPIAARLDAALVDANSRGLTYAEIVDFARVELDWIQEFGDPASSARAKAAIDHIRARCDVMK